MRAWIARVGVPISLAVLAVIAIGSTTAGASQGSGKNESPQLWFVQYPTAPLADGSSDAAVASDQKSFESQAKAADISYVQRMRFTDLFNGVSIAATPSAMAKIEGFSSVEAVYPIQTHQIPETQQASPDLATAIQMTGADIAQNELGLTGKGIRVAVMDTGIDYDNPDLGGGFGKQYRVQTGWDFVGDAYNADPESPAYDPTPVPDPNPDDCNGHGTHVAGIIGAKGEVTGVAPGVTFGAYRVFGCEGSTTDDIMLAAMERILHDHMDVLNMSIGASFENWPGYPTAVAASTLVRKGVIVVASIGNSGANGMFSAGAPGVGDNVIGVASFDNTYMHLPIFRVSPDNKGIGFDQAVAAATAPTSGSGELVLTGTPNNEGCSAYSPTVAGKIALVKRGGCGFAVKAQNAQAAGAAALVIYNNQSGRVTPTVAGAVPITIPVVAVSQADGLDLVSRVGAGTTTLTWTSETASFPNATGGLISSFSSYGLAADLTTKPDIGAPGGFIWSTYPLEKGGHASLSGTSMASPHVAGAVALLLQSKGLQRNQIGEDNNSWRSNRDDASNVNRAMLVRDVLENSADPKMWGGNPTLGFLDNVQRQGSGMLDIPAAVEAETLVYPGKLSLGEGNGGTKTISLVNNSKETVTYTFGSEAALATGGIYTVSQVVAPSTVTFSPSSLTLQKGESASVAVTITPNAGLATRRVYGGWLVVNASNQEHPLRVAYTGFKGDYQSIPIITFAGLYSATGDDPTGSPWTLQGADRPTIWWNAQLQSRHVQLLVLDSTGNVLGRAMDVEYYPRNSTASTFFAQPWDGTYMPGLTGSPTRVTAPDGTYSLRLTALKPLGDPTNPADTETFTSDPFVIERP